MKGDFARVTFDPALHYSHVFQQQGRVLLEADWNEQAQIQLHLLRALVKDLVGPCWAAGNGFGLTTSTTDAKGAVKPLLLADWELSPGHFYVDGILCVNEAVCTVATQPQAPTPDYGVADGKNGFENPPAGYALWLDVWERHLSWVEAPAINDAALDGVDTASRAQVVWQLRMLDQTLADQQLDGITAALKVRLQATSNTTDIAAIKQQLIDVGNLRKSIDGNANTNSNPCALLRQLLGARRTYALPRLLAQLGPVDVDSDPCVIAADARYRGCENQLYRVEVHQGGLAGTAAAATATSFKWSRENGSVVFPLVASAAGAAAADGSAALSVTLASFGRDARLGLAVNDWVELVDDDYTLAQRAFPLLQVIALDAANRSVTLNVPKNVTPYQPSNDPRRHPLLRRWDQHAGVNVQGVVAMGEGASLDLEDGIQISFEPGGMYATGDYWLIPARVAGSGMLDWPQVTGADGKSGPAALPPRGLHHHAVLGVSDANGGYQECCCRFGTLCDLIQAKSQQPGKIDQTPVLAPIVAGNATVVTKKPAATKAKPKKKATKPVP
ncbi:DUF6519 domain-containing protein [Rhodanobacter sp. Col0626]|uniref:DUF6519 domain-containing protein n=1 Tax=Rhodanobacter sp. Col0626 TaxID=3415679 RepID=UPI003CF86429